MTATKPDARLGQALAHLKRGETILGAALLETILKDLPRDPMALSLAGAVALQRGDRKGAIALIGKSLELSPNDASAHSNIALAYSGEGRLDDAQRHLERALALNPNSAEALINLGNLLRQRSDHPAAEQLYRRALAIRPDLAEAHNNLALVLDKLGRPLEALPSAKRAIELNPRFAEAYRTLGTIYDSLGRFDEAIAALRQAIALRPRDARAHADLGNTLLAFGKTSDAAESYRKAAELDPGRGNYQRMLGRLGASGGTPAEQRARFELASTPAEERLHLGFALGKAAEEAGDYPRAFAYLEQANRLNRQTYRYAPRDSEAAFAEIEAAFTPELFATHSRTGDPDPTPIFVLGMPRSGTTLVEQILASHPEVTGAGELPLLRDLVAASTTKRPIRYAELLADLTDEAIAGLGSIYIRRLRAFSDTTRFITDKMPGNFLLIGIIALALPNARIVHCTRDPADTSISIWRNYFASHLGYAYDLAEIGHYHRLYQHLMDHWHRVLPGRIYDISYEALVDDQQGETHRLLAHCGLDFRPECLDFFRTERPVHTASAAQVRSPISRSSIGIAARYGELLAPLHAALKGEGDGN